MKQQRRAVVRKTHKAGNLIFPLRNPRKSAARSLRHVGLRKMRNNAHFAPKSDSKWMSHDLGCHFASTVERSAAAGGREAMARGPEAAARVAQCSSSCTARPQDIAGSSAAQSRRRDEGNNGVAPSHLGSDLFSVSPKEWCFPQ